MDLIIRHARLRGREGTCDIGITGDRITVVAEQLTDEAITEVDAAGNLVMPTYVNGHIHLDKCFLQEKMRPNKDYTFSECLELTWEHKAQYTTEDILERAGRAIEEGILNGTTVFRAFADVDSIGQLRGLEGLLALREHWRNVVHIEVVAFPQEGIIRDPGTAELLEEAMRLGADIVGGLPWFEMLDEDARAHIDFCFDLAKRYDDPWTNLVLARERDIELVVGDGQPRYGTASLMKAAGAVGATSMRVGGVTRQFVLNDPTDPTKRWKWAAVMDQLRTVQADPVKAIDLGLALEAFEADVTTPITGTLILESDMPGGPNSVAGPPPPGTKFDAPPLPTLVHDDAWFQAVRAAGYHEHLLDNLDALFAADAVLT